MTGHRIVHLKGRVLPEVRNVSLDKQFEVKVDDPTGVKGIFYISAENGRLTVRCEIENSPSNLASRCLVKAVELASVPIDLIAFSKGWFLSIIFDEVVEGTVGSPTAMSELSLQKHVTILDTPVGFAESASILFENFELRFAIHDLISSLATLNYSAIAAARAVEAIRSDMAQVGTSDSNAWKHMRKMLNIDEAFLKFVTNASIKPRHGNRGATDGKLQMEVTHRAWAIMNRYLQFKLRGGQNALPASEFPVLIDSLTNNSIGVIAESTL